MTLDGQLHLNKYKLNNKFKLFLFKLEKFQLINKAGFGAPNGAWEDFPSKTKFQSNFNIF